MVLHIPQTTIEDMHDGRRLCLPKYILHQTKGLVHDIVDHDFFVKVFHVEKSHSPGRDIVEWFGSIVLIVWVDKGINIQKNIQEIVEYKNSMKMKWLCEQSNTWAQLPQTILSLLASFLDFLIRLIRFELPPPATIVTQTRWRRKQRQMLRATLSTWHSSGQSSNSRASD